MVQMSIVRAIEGFLLAREADGKSKQTIRWYRHNLTQFTSWFERIPHEDHLGAIQPDHVREFLKYLRESHLLYGDHPFKPQGNKRGCSDRSILGKYAALSAFFNWAVAEGLFTKSPMSNMRRPKVAKTLVPVFSRDEIVALLTAADANVDDALAARNKAMLMLLLDTGVRLGELLNMKIDGLTINNNSIQVTGKGSKDRVVFLGAQCKKQLWRYVTLFRAEPLGNTSNIFLNKDGTAMRARMIEKTIENIADKAGIKNVHPHRFRHTAAVQFLRNGGNVFALQKMLGHSSLEMVRYYVELSQDDVKKVHKTASPADNWGLK